MTALYFGDFRFDTASLSLWREAETVALTPKASAVLSCLLGRAGQLVSKDELLDAVWPDTAVGDASLKVCVQEIRRALGDRVEAPRFIATEHRRGYRFIAALAVPAVAPPAAPVLSGRAAELAGLRAAWSGRAAATARQCSSLVSWASARRPSPRRSSPAWRPTTPPSRTGSAWNISPPARRICRCSKPWGD